jgi:ketosteroid isomerase-like protein
MSEANVEIVKATIDAFNRGDRDGALKSLASDFELDFSRAIGPLRGVFALDQISRFREEFIENWEAIRIEPQEFMEVGDHVCGALDRARQRSVGMGSRCPLVSPGYSRSVTER